MLIRQNLDIAFLHGQNPLSYTRTRIPDVWESSNNLHIIYSVILLLPVIHEAASLYLKKWEAF
jgi:hypothetical protein